MMQMRKHQRNKKTRKSELTIGCGKRKAEEENRRKAEEDKFENLFNKVIKKK